MKGMRVEPGMKLYRIADLSTVWLYADIYESEVPLVREGQTVTISLSYYPGENIQRHDYVHLPVPRYPDPHQQSALGVRQSAGETQAWHVCQQ